MMPHTHTQILYTIFIFFILPIYLERDDSRFHWLRPKAEAGDLRQSENIVV